jgi:hypothetical protein
MRRFLGYFNGISYRGGQFHVASTGAAISVNRSVAKSAWAVFKIYLYHITRGPAGLFARKQRRYKIAFYPSAPGPWYNIWQTLRFARIETVEETSDADFVFMFEDSTHIFSAPPAFDAPMINDRITDISKTRVAEVFETTFGYGLSVDPVTYTGPAVEKSDSNGTHDGAVVTCPLAPEAVKAGFAYQRLVDTRLDDDTHYLDVSILGPQDVFTPEEITLITDFCENMGLDFGAVDVMRDVTDGRIYIVDVNKTCMPVLWFDLKTQIGAQTQIAEALVRGLEARVRVSGG